MVKLIKLNQKVFFALGWNYINTVFSEYELFGKCSLVEKNISKKYRVLLLDGYKVGNHWCSSDPSFCRLRPRDMTQLISGRPRARTRSTNPSQFFLLCNVSLCSLLSSLLLLKDSF